jgi:hypothetical protein
MLGRSNFILLKGLLVTSSMASSLSCRSNYSSIFDLRLRMFSLGAVTFWNFVIELKAVYMKQIPNSISVAETNSTLTNSIR